MSTRVVFSPLSGGNGCSLISAAATPDLRAVGYSDVEYSARGTVTGVAQTGPAGAAEFTTRIVVRRPVDPDTFSGTIVVEWLNVSSGNDAAPEYSYVAEELVRSGHAWVGVSAQYVGIEGGTGSVGLAADGPTSLAQRDPERYGSLHHPGDAYCHAIYELLGREVRETGGHGHPLARLDVDRVLAVGESQSAMALTTYVTRCADAGAGSGVFDGYLIHSRAAAGLPLGTVAAGIDVTETFAGAPVTIPDKVGAPVFIVQTETDLVTDFQFHQARQPDSAWVRTWELAGTAHADLFQVGPFEEFLGCPEPVNQGQQRFVLRAALAQLNTWVIDGTAPPCAAPLELSGSGTDAVFVTDDVGNVVGGVRTPSVDAPTQLLTGVVDNPVSRIHLLFGATRPIPPEVLAARYGSAASYLEKYEAAVDAVIAGGFALAADRAELLADANPELVG